METLPPVDMPDSSLEEKAKAAAKETAKRLRPTEEERQEGIADLKEVIAFGITLTATALRIAGDGFGPLDVIDVLRADDLREAFGPAVDDISDVPGEIADLSVREGIRLADFAWGRIEQAFL